MRCAGAGGIAIHNENDRLRLKDRRAVYEILIATKKGLPDDWGAWPEESPSPKP